MKLRKMKLVEICFLVLFAVILLSAILFATILGSRDGSPEIALALFLLDFPIAAIVAFYASLSIREEEEEKSQVLD